MTTRDDKTGLMNLGAFTFVVDHVVRRASRSGECATVLSIVVHPGPEPTTSDRGNDRAPLYGVARLLRTELRGEDVLARVGEHEFAVALPDTDADGAEIVVDWITSKLADQGVVAVGGDGPVVSVGRATFEPSNGPVPANDLLSAARVSTRGPSHVFGTEPLVARGPVVARTAVGKRRGPGPGPGPGGADARRHLHSLDSGDA